jgi:drug/metabolite transporter (DMT)-like permease
MNAFMITAYRFIFASMFLFVMLFFSKSLPKRRQVSNKIVSILVVTSVLLVVNYVSNVFALIYVSPSTVQIAPFALMLGSVILYSE